MIDWSQCPAVERIPGKMSGAWLLKGTRMPVQTIFETSRPGSRCVGSPKCSTSPSKRSTPSSTLSLTAWNWPRHKDEDSVRQRHAAAHRTSPGGHQVSHAPRIGWHALKNGERLQCAEEQGFDVLLTTDRNIRSSNRISKDAGSP